MHVSSHRSAALGTMYELVLGVVLCHCYYCTVLCVRDTRYIIQLGILYVFVLLSCTSSTHHVLCTVFSVQCLVMIEASRLRSACKDKHLILSHLISCIQLSHLGPDSIPGHMR